MLRSVLLKTVRDRRRAVVWWTVGMFGYILFLDGFWPFIDDQREELINAFPPQLLAIFGVDSGGDLFSPSGYLNSRSFGWVVPVVFSLYAASIGARAIAGEEEDNTIDLLASTPISRARLVWEKWLALVTVMSALGVALLAALILGDAVFGLEITVGHYAAATISAVLLAVVIGSLALALGAGGLSRGAAMGIAAAVTVTGFLLNSLGSAVPELATARKVSPFYYYDSHKPLDNGLDPAHASVLAGLALVAAGAGVMGIRRRDLGV
jgi:ABC-2 type transport system permease protein